ncbi:hypothetical protein PROFUN_06986 [Planoprotostelium fungivorum]|uniref:Uncharacterized protein n=1 Tax=Planoprotostelium fungivorum TaxID=1890364 RepID=A0A2P6NMM6_9EUKA|nr:hypothetical protein PROFUN_06986 [Planoprotostelium fungivorum]
MIPQSCLGVGDRCLALKHEFNEAFELSGELRDSSTTFEPSSRWLLKHQDRHRKPVLWHQSGPSTPIPFLQHIPVRVFYFSAFQSRSMDNQSQPLWDKFKGPI